MDKLLRHLWYHTPMARPVKEQQWIIEERNRVIKGLASSGISQADIGRIMRLPRNTVSVVLSKKT